ncbi:hypothetical protein CPC08DRAFT_321557 [Agrocybe pediades]|nr:hypothetical protein CPC08DRAFT_321557 [Agrocybe pediades]
MDMPGFYATGLSSATLKISDNVLALPAPDRRVLLALLKWSPYVSQRLSAALEAIASPWVRRCTEEDYLLILYDLEQCIRQTPIIWADVARINIRLDNLYACLQQVVPTFSAQGDLKQGSAVGDSASFFHSAQQIAIHGGSFTIYSPGAVAATPREAAAPTAPASSVMDVPLLPRQAPTINVPADGAEQALEERPYGDSEVEPPAAGLGIMGAFGIVKRFVMGCF